MNSMFDELKQRVCEANLALKHAGLVIRTWGNASAVDQDRKVVCIKPSGVAYDVMTPEDMVITDFSGEIVEGAFRPSVDLASHLALYQAFPEIGGVVHTHSHYATCFAQARREIPCFGTTHADYFEGSVPLVPAPSRAEVEEDYERNTGLCIVRCFSGRASLRCPAALVAGHGPFVWGSSLEKAVENAEVLEELARMAFHTLSLEPTIPSLEPYLLEKHFQRKHGGQAYYGQDNGG